MQNRLFNTRPVTRQKKLQQSTFTIDQLEEEINHICSNKIVMKLIPQNARMKYNISLFNIVNNSNSISKHPTRYFILKNLILF